MAEIIFTDAMGIIVQCIICIAVIDILAGIAQTKKAWFLKVSWLIVNFLFWMYAVEIGDIWNVVVVILDIIGYCVYIMILKDKDLVTTVALVMTTQIINQAGAVLVTAIVYGWDVLGKNNAYHIYFLIFGYVIRVLLLGIVYVVEKKYKISELLKRSRNKLVIIFIGVSFQFTRLTFRKYYKNMNNIFLYIAITILLAGVIFSILWVIDWYYNEREKKLLWEDNHRMSQRLHKSKEIIPALSVVLEELKSNKDFGEFNDILDEIHQLCKEQIDENEKLSIQNKTFPTTEIRVLDEQIQLYETEAIEKDINFDVFVGTPMRQVLREKRIKELDFLRIIGDLMRNAFRAIERTGGEGGNILLVMGCVGEVLQIDIYDSGAPFPMFVLNEFGKRGNTEGGTGNGLSDTLELLEKYQATFLLTEYEDGTAYTKGISIIWDDKNERRLDSRRISMLSKDSPLFPKES